MAHRYDLKESHSSWSCGYQRGTLTACPTDCVCACHGNGQADEMRRRGLHVHDWLVRIYLLLGHSDKLSIRCAVCGMYVPRDTKPNVVEP